MRRIGWTATVAAVALLIVSCRQPGPEPPESVTADEPTQQTGRPEIGHQPAADEADAEDPDEALPESSYGRVLYAIGGALKTSVFGDAEADTGKEREEAPRFNPQ